MKKSILLVGIGNDIYREYGVKEIFDVGIDILLLSSSCPDWAKQYVSHFYQCDLSDSDRAISLCEEISATQSVSAITTFIEPWIELCAEISDHLSLRFLNLKTAKLIRNKSTLRNFLVSNGLSNVWTRQIEDDQGRTLDGIQFPFILKPKSGFASLNVYLIQNMDEYRAAIKSSEQADFNGFPNPGDSYFIESYIEGTEYSVEGVVSESEVHVYAVTDKYLSQSEGFEEVGHIVPANIPNETTNSIVSYVTEVVGKTGLRNCAFHAELKVSLDRIEIIEIGARPAGDLIPYLVRMVTGISMNAEMAKVALGLKPMIKEESSKVAGIAFLVPTEPFVCESEIDDTQFRVDADEVKIWLVKGKEYLTPPQRFFERCGYVIASGQTQESVISKLNSIITKISRKCGVSFQLLVRRPL